MGERAARVVGHSDAGGAGWLWRAQAVDARAQQQDASMHSIMIYETVSMF